MLATSSSCSTRRRARPLTKLSRPGCELPRVDEPRPSSSSTCSSTTSSRTGSRSRKPSNVSVSASSAWEISATGATKTRSRSTTTSTRFVGTTSARHGSGIFRCRRSSSLAVALGGRLGSLRGPPISIERYPGLEFEIVTMEDAQKRFSTYPPDPNALIVFDMWVRPHILVVRRAGNSER